MLDLAAKNSKVFQYFKSGGFVVCLRERHWAGLACDLTLEQVLMRSLKTKGGNYKRKWYIKCAKIVMAFVLTSVLKL